MVLLCVAGLRKEKGHADLLNAVSLLSEMGTPVRLLLAGSGPLEGQLRATRDQMGLQGRVVFLGLRDDVPDLLAAADLFVLASHFEGLPVAVMEALAAGKPVVATEVGGLPEAVANGVEGLLVPPSRPDRLAEAIARLVADPALRAQMAEAAQQRGATFDIALTARELETIYLDVASSARRVGDGPLHRRLLPKRHDST
jgi:glycosyltransferase involved in cell wall biosynthesis